jgi:glycosyltransferase involved in cell wall biosynthesis
MHKKKPYVLHLCHDYKPPFLSVARQYGLLFKDSPYRIVTVYLKGKPDTLVTAETAADEVIYLQNSSKDLRGRKRKQIKQIKELHANYNFAFSIAHRYKAIYIASHISGLHVLGIHHIDGVYKRFFRRLYVKKKQHQLTLIGVSKAIRDDIRKSLPAFPEENTDYLYNSLDFDEMKQRHLSRQEAREKLRIPEGSFAFGNVGRLHNDKDQTTLLKAFAKASSQMPEAILVIAGKGPLEEDLKKITEELCIQTKVKFLGMLPEASRYYKAFDCFSLSSIREGLPVALLEAFAADLVCIASLCNGNAEAIEGCGFSFEIGDIDTLSSKMHEAYSLKKDTKEKITSAVVSKREKYFTQEAVKDFFWSNTIKHYEK